MHYCYLQCKYCFFLYLFLLLLITEDRDMHYLVPDWLTLKQVGPKFQTDQTSGIIIPDWLKLEWMSGSRMKSTTFHALLLSSKYVSIAFLYLFFTLVLLITENGRLLQLILEWAKIPDWLDEWDHYTRLTYTTVDKSNRMKSTTFHALLLSSM